MKKWSPRAGTSCHVVDVGPNVLEVFERAISTYARPVGGSARRLRILRRRSPPVRFGLGPDAPVEYHVDAGSMHALVDSLVEALDLLDSYTLVVLDPRKSILGRSVQLPTRSSAPRRSRNSARDARSSSARRVVAAAAPPRPAPAPRLAPPSRTISANARRVNLASTIACTRGRVGATRVEQLDLARASRERDGALFTDALATLTGDDPAAARRLTVALEGFAAAEAAAEDLGDRAAEAMARAQAPTATTTRRLPRRRARRPARAPLS